IGLGDQDVFRLDVAMDHVAGVERVQRPADVRRHFEERGAVQGAFLLNQRVKDEQVLQAAYNDAQGITGQFNLNVLSVLNEQLDGDFDTELFRHQAIYNSDKQRIEMYLIAEQAHSIQLHSLNEELYLHKDEKILTEISQKYTYQDIEALLTGAGLSILKHTESDNQWFSLVLAGL
ncbi:MAG: L-histidine N(alpha)-methyltransferase, partial [Gammaproteobacteria bacterium]|nr:L-histidine N(alpha)-methyltransferase [Gammaproteobacteria bacterium]